MSMADKPEIDAGHLDSVAGRLADEVPRRHQESFPPDFVRAAHEQAEKVRAAEQAGGDDAGMLRRMNVTEEELRRVGATPEQAKSLLDWVRDTPPEAVAAELREKARQVASDIEAEMAADRRKVALGLGAVAAGAVVVLVILARRRGKSD
jgi:hypothetical protein